MRYCFWQEISCVPSSTAKLCAVRKCSLPSGTHANNEGVKETKTRCFSCGCCAVINSLLNSGLCSKHSNNLNLKPTQEDLIKKTAFLFMLEHILKIHSVEERSRFAQPIGAAINPSGTWSCLYLKCVTFHILTCISERSCSVL